ncbi:MAG TPA: hypothetical protein VEK38_00535, partial [Candidatus Bathyarchaeia archaeon]|nr:hypothetical protein [Candidatus Bathyarchaeia archaeon]
VLLDKKSALMFGAEAGQEITWKMHSGSSCLITHPDACLSFVQGTYDVIIDGYLIVREGIFACNTDASEICAGHLRLLSVGADGIFQLEKKGNFVCASNDRKEEKEQDTTWHVAGTFVSDGAIRLYNRTRRTFFAPVLVQTAVADMTGSLADIIAALTVKKKKNISYVTIASNVDDDDISDDNVDLEGIFSNGFIVPLKKGDHQLFYDSSGAGDEKITVIRGYDGHNRLFTIHPAGFRQLHCQGGGMCS